MKSHVSVTIKEETFLHLSLNHYTVSFPCLPLLINVKVYFRSVTRKIPVVCYNKCSLSERVPAVGPAALLLY